MKLCAVVLFSFCLLLPSQSIALAFAPQPPASASEELLWVTNAVDAPRVSFHTMESESAKRKISYHLYRPELYQQEPASRFPVVYWLHGSGGGLPGIPRVAALFDAAIAAGKTPPCLVVFVNGLPNGMYVDWKDGSAPLETIFIRELLPHIDATYRTVANRDGRLLDGYSMGGYGAARFGFKYPDLFASVSIMGGGPLQTNLMDAPRAGQRRAAEVLQQVYGGDPDYFTHVSPRRLAEENASRLAKGSQIRMVCGDQDETFSANESFHQHLEKLSIPHRWQVLPGVDHNPMKTLEALGDSNWEFYRSAFRAALQPASSPPDREADLEIQLEVKGKSRRAVVVHAPTDGSKRPAVLVLHGGMGSAAVMQANTGFDLVAKAKGFMVVYPEGTDFGGGRHAWNTGYLMRRMVQGADDIAYFDQLIDRLIDDHDADPNRIYMTGGSNGGMMTYVYAVQRPQKLAAIAPVVASMFSFETKPATPLPILIINGAKDEEVPIEGGMSRNPVVRRAQQAPFQSIEEVAKFWVSANASKSEPLVSVDGTVTTKRYEATEGGATTEVVIDSAGGHGWPGARARRDGNQPIGSFSGAERVWEFFADKCRADKLRSDSSNPAPK
ncbi:MAG: alpha/beta hydrolase-fold protein [Pirellulaceae bacterium]